MRISIRNMVCRHCIEAVERVLDSLSVAPREVMLGEAVIPDTTDDASLGRIDAALRREGFELILDPDVEIVERVRHAVIHHVRDEEECRLNLSACIESQIGMPYDAVSRIFSRVEGRTIESYCASQRIERVKELLDYGELTLGEIAWRTGFSSTAHLSRRFKELTGMTPSDYKKARKSLRKPLPDA